MERRGDSRERRAPSRTKMLPRRVRRGQEGINLIERIVLQMGSSWSPTGALDVGIDGYIELFDPATNEALGKILAVQSRVLATFANETGEGFDYSCEERDLTYWLDGNIVLLIVSRPERNEAYWVSIKDYFSTPERRRARIAHFAKIEQRFDASCLQRLLRSCPQLRTSALPPPVLRIGQRDLLSWPNASQCEFR